MKLRLATVVGGMSIGRQAGALRGGAEVVVATPGRLKDLIDRGDCRLDQVAITVLDEADQMADMGFMPQVTALLDQVRPEGQRMLFSATLDRNVDLLVRRYLHDPVVHSVDPSAGAVTTMEHHVLHVARRRQARRPTTEIAARDGRVIMFLDTKHARRPAHQAPAEQRRPRRRPARRQVPAAAHPHPGPVQDRRRSPCWSPPTSRPAASTSTTSTSSSTSTRPTDHKDYLHRGGRTARAGESGSVVTLVLPEPAPRDDPPDGRRPASTRRPPRSAPATPN